MSDVPNLEVDQSARGAVPQDVRKVAVPHSQHRIGHSIMVRIIRDQPVPCEIQGLANKRGIAALAEVVVLASPRSNEGR